MKSKSFNTISLLALTLAIGLPLYFRGLYFEQDLLPVLIGIGLMFAIWSGIKIKNKEYDLFKDPTDYLFFGIVLIYALSFFYGVDRRAALFEFFKHLAYFIIFIMVKDLSFDDKYKKILLNIILLGGVFVSLVGIGTAIGTWDYHGAMLGNRMSSTFQYPNTLAAFVGSLYFLGLSMMINQEKVYLKPIYGVITGTFLFTLILTYSRAMWLIFPLVAIVYFLLAPNNRKLETFIYMLSSAVLSLPAALIFARTLDNPTSSMWTIFLAASLGTGLLVFLLGLPYRAYRRVPLVALFIVIGILLVGGISATFYALGATSQIEFVNNSEDNKSSSISRNISKTLPLSSYELDLTYEAVNESEAPYAGRVRIYNIDTEGKASEIAYEDIVESSKGKTSVEFSTPEDSIGVRLLLSNYYGNTSITYWQASIIDLKARDLLYEVPLNYKYIPESIVIRASSLGIGSTSSDARIVFFKDGLNIVKDHLILGAGGGGWVTLYQRYQSYPYWTTQAHNYILQLWIEIGTIGLIMFALFFLMLTALGAKTYFKSEDTDRRVIILGVYTSLITMLGHATIDFDMSLPSFAIVFWALMGIMTSTIIFLCPIRFDNFRNTSSRYFSYALLGASILVLVNGLEIRSSVKFADMGVEAVEVGDIDTTIVNYEKASGRDKYNTDYYHDLTSLYMKKYEDTEKMDYAQKAFEASQNLMELSQHNPSSYGSMASFYMSIGQLDEALRLLDMAVEMQPMISDQYIAKGKGYLAVFQYYYENEEYDKAREILERALEIKDTLQEVSKRTLRPLSTNMDLIYSIGELQYYLENFDAPDLPFAMGYNLNFAYFFDIDANNDGQIDMLGISKPAESNLAYDYMEESGQGFLRLRNDGEKQGYIYVYNISMEPDSEYLVQVKARGSLGPENMNIMAVSSGAEEPTQGRLNIAQLDQEWFPYIFEFVTDSDIVKGKQQIRIQLVGNDPGYVDIKELAIFKKDKI